YREGDRFAIPELADTLDRLAADGSSILYTGELAQRIAAHTPAVSVDDLAAYEVVEREPVSVAYRAHEFRSNPPPSGGGALISLGLRALGERDVTASAIADAMEAQEAARSAALASALKGTTHISVVDADGNAASLSSSLE